MPGVYVPNADAGYLHSDAPDLARKLVEGDGILWPGDPRLELRVGVLTWPQTCWQPTLGRRVRRGEIAARRYEVWRYCEDGSEQMVGHWRLEDFDRILLELAPMRLDAPGHVSVLDRIDTNNDAMEKANSQRMVEALAAPLEHALKIKHDTTEGRTVFRGMPGLNPAKQD